MTPEPEALDDLFAQARDAAPPPLDTALLRRLTADAERLRPRGQPGWRRALAGLAGALGGMPGLASVAAAGVAGLWIGVATPGMGDTAWSSLVDAAARTPDWASAGTWPSADDDSLLALMAGTSE